MGFIFSRNGNRQRSNTTKVEEGNDKGPKANNDAANVSDLVLPTRPFRMDNEKEDYPDYTKHLLRKIDPDDVPKKPLLAAKWFLQKYTMLAAALKKAEAKNAELAKAISVIDEESEAEDEYDEEYLPGDADANERKKRLKEIASNLKSSTMARVLAKASPDQQKGLEELRKKTEYARAKAESESAY